MLLSKNRAIVVFIIFSLGYFLSSLLRSVTATLAPSLSVEFALSAGQLGLLGSAYFFGFALMQLPLGRWLDQFGPRHMLVIFLSLGVGSSVLFAWAPSFAWMLLARFLGGIGMCACLMGPLLGYRHWLDGDLQLRANSWMLMVGAAGLLMATSPVQAVVPIMGWRALFMALAGLFALTILLILWQVPRWHKPQASALQTQSLLKSYAPIVRNPYFWTVAPLALVNNGGMMAMQTLWAGPWLTKVTGLDAHGAAQGLFIINSVMLVVYAIWGWVLPRLTHSGISVNKLLRWGVPFSLTALLLVIVLGAAANGWVLSLFFGASSLMLMVQPALAMRYAPQEAGRALTAYNVLIFGGAFAWQWGLGLLVDVFLSVGFSTLNAYRGAFGVLGLCALLAYLWLLWRLRSEHSQ